MNIRLATVFFAVVALLLGCKNECRDIRCANGGVCDNSRCACADGFSGIDCSINDRDAILGKYSGNEICGGDTSTNVVIELIAGEGEREIILVQHHKNDNIERCSMGRDFSFHTSENYHPSFNINGKVTDGILTYTQKRYDNNLPVSCTYNGNRQ